MKKPRGFGSAAPKGGKPTVKKMAKGGSPHAGVTHEGGRDSEPMLGGKPVREFLGLPARPTPSAPTTTEGGPRSMLDMLRARIAGAKQGDVAQRPAPTTRRVYNPMPRGYNPAVQGEWNFYSEVPMKKGGKVATKPKPATKAKPKGKK